MRASLGVSMALALSMMPAIPHEWRGRWPDWQSIAQARKSKTTKRKVRKARRRK